MGEREFVIYLDEAQENRYRHQHVWERGEIVEFRIQYEAFIAGQWHAVVRYDTAHVLAGTLRLVFLFSSDRFSLVKATLPVADGSLGFRMMLAVDHSPRPADGDCGPL